MAVLQGHGFAGRTAAPAAAVERAVRLTVPLVLLALVGSLSALLWQDEV